MRAQTTRLDMANLALIRGLLCRCSRHLGILQKIISLSNVYVYTQMPNLTYSSIVEYVLQLQHKHYFRNLKHHPLILANPGCWIE
jgi:hypothetical protein